jgi:hypothetical protein
MQLEVEQLTVDTVLGRSVEVRLHAVEGDFAVSQVRVKQTGSLRHHLVFARIQLIDELGAFLVEALGGGDIDRLIFNSEVLPEVLEDGNFCLEVDWSLLRA